MKTVKELIALANTGDTNAQNKLATYYHTNAMRKHGYNMNNNLEKARYWLNKLADTGNAEYQYEFGAFLWHYATIEQAIVWYTRAANQGHAEAQHSLSLCEQYLAGTMFQGVNI